MTQKHFILATAGHVDHGKTALVKALTGADTDRLPEEKARGITIDLGFAHLTLPSTINHPLSTLSIGVIDVPGHEDFVRNMIAGIGSIDLALLVVAADDGWMPQTEEHLQILDYLDVSRIVVALTKSDLGNVAARTREVREQLCSTRFADTPIVATSVRDLSTIELLRETLAREFAQLPAARDLQKPRLFVDRVFTVRGSGTVVTGTLSGGRLSRGEKVSIQPQNLIARIRAIQSHNQPLERAEPGMRTALNLADLTPNEIARGAVITAVRSADAAQTVDVLLERSKRLPATSRPLKRGALVHVHYGSARLIARVTLLDQRELFPGERSIARLRFASPIFVFVGDRFIVRDASAQQTIAGGVVLEANADSIKFRSTRERAFLMARAQLPNDCLTLVRTQLQRDHFAARAELLEKSRFAREEIGAAIGELGASGALFANDQIVVEGAWWEVVRQSAREAIDAEHAAHPDRGGMELNQLRDALRLQAAPLFEALLMDLCGDGFVQAGKVVRRATHRPSLPPRLRPVGERIRAALSDRPLEPPSRKELASDADAQQALRFLCETGEVIALNDDVLLTADVFAKLKASIVAHLGKQRGATISELRQAAGGTRRILVPLLERLDREGLTIRQGDRRSLR